MNTTKYIKCPFCEKQMKLYNGESLFFYNIECCNGHRMNKIYIDDLLIEIEKSNVCYNCKRHNKKKIIHCFDCKEDICLDCFNYSHKTHRTEYLISLFKTKLDFFKPKIKEEKIAVDNIIYELKDFLKKISQYIDIYINEIEKNFQFKFNLVYKKQPFSYIDIENIENLFQKPMIKNQNSILSLFTSCKTFFEKYDNFKTILKDLFNTGKYIENINFINKINYSKEHLNHIAWNYYYKNYMNKIEIFKEITNPSNKATNLERIFWKSFNFQEIELKSFKAQELKLYGISMHRNKKYISLITINNISNNKKEYYLSKTFQLDIDFWHLLVLNENQNIIIDKSYNIYLYDDSFKKKEKIIDKVMPSSAINKINDKILAYAIKDNDSLYVINISDDGIINKYFVKNCGKKIIGYLEEKNFLITKYNKYICLINLNLAVPEVIQKIEFNYEITEIYPGNFKGDNIFLEIVDNSKFNYLIHYKMVYNNFIEVSKHIIKI